MVDSAIGTDASRSPSDASIWLRALRLYSISASVVPVVLGGMLALGQRDGSGLWLLPLAVLAAVCLHLGTNLANDLGDFRSGVDRLGGSEGSGVLTGGLLSEAQVARAAYGFFALGGVLGLPNALARGWPVWALGILGLLGGWGYTMGPRYKYLGLGDLCVFALMGPLMALGGGLAMSGQFELRIAAAAVPIGLWVVAILHANNFRDLEADGESGIHTVARALGWRGSLVYLAVLMVAAYGALAACCAFHVLPWPALAAFATAPGALGLWRRAARAYAPAERRGAMLVEDAAKLHLLFGLLAIAGIAASRLLH
jgi:1,4-dihydroxy-2-naphthoate octaprenyltransferase